MAIPSEWRIDPITGRRVLIAPARGERPLDRHGCPFCEGNEAETTKEVFAVRTAASLPNKPGWRVRVIPNRYAAVRWYQETMPAVAHGVAELFVECPHHETRFEQLPVASIVENVSCWRQRLSFWQVDGRVTFAQVFKNQGRFAGASLDHCHSQLIGVQVVPDLVQRECDLLRTHRERTGNCLTCDYLLQERTTSRFVTETEHFVVLAPQAARFPGEMWLVPTQHAAHFHRTEEAVLPELARLLQTILQHQVPVFDAPNYNIVVKSAPFQPVSMDYHWRIELLPRTTGIAGWEWGTGIIINTMTPEVAAERLRRELGG